MKQVLLTKLFLQALTRLRGKFSPSFATMQTDDRWDPQLVEAHLIPGATLRAADLQPGVRYQTALPGAFLTVEVPLL